jgi:NOL1/NOP2/sun family putative RNA methylase
MYKVGAKPMSEHLPQAFVNKMNELLADQFPVFMASYDEQRYYGLRVNTLKASANQFKAISPFDLEAIPWVNGGFYYEDGVRPGKHPYYNAGLYYIQEPSAMAPVELLDIQPGDKVLDLCAAPGGKSTQIAAKLDHSGVLVVNDNHNERIKALVKNLELFGVRNAVVLNELPHRLSSIFKGYFDKILVDAPCSGEGMFRKEEEMAKQWGIHSPGKYADMQREILKQAAQMLIPGGKIVYSTCTFSPEENECIIADFIQSHADFRVVPINAAELGFSAGRPDWVQAACANNAISDEAIKAVKGTARLWPHLIKGEGHFIAVLERRKQVLAEIDENHAKSAITIASQDLSLWSGFMQDQLTREFSGVEVMYGEYLYLMPPGFPSLDGIKVVRPGWFIGAIRKNRFEPAHALAMGMLQEDAVRTLQLDMNSSEAVRYLKGETLIIAELRIHRKPSGAVCKGWCLVCIDGFPLGWAKWQDGMLKNEYPAGWRWTS